MVDRTSNFEIEVRREEKKVKPKVNWNLKYFAPGKELSMKEVTFEDMTYKA
jgi:hypothetical protein